MSLMKRYLEQISEEIGEEGAINDRVLAEAAIRLRETYPETHGDGRVTPGAEDLGDDNKG